MVKVKNYWFPKGGQGFTETRMKWTPHGLTSIKRVLGGSKEPEKAILYT